MFAEGGFYLYYIPQGNKSSDEERKIIRKNLRFMYIKRFNKFIKRWGQFRMGAIPRVPKLFYGGDIQRLVYTIV